MRIFRTKLLAPALIVLLALSGHSVGAADQSAEGAYKASVAAMKAHDFAGAIPDLRYASERGVFLAQYYLARLYAIDGQPFTNHKLAFNLLRGLVAANRGVDPYIDKRAPFVANAERILAIYYRQGIRGEIPADPVLANAHLEHAALRLGDTEAQFQLAILDLQSPELVPRALDTLDMLAQSKHHAGAAAQIALVYSKGRQHERPPFEALGYALFALKLAGEADRIWIGDIYQSLFCQASATERAKAMALADELERGAFDVTDGDRQPAEIGRNRPHQQGVLDLGEAETQRVCGNGERVPELAGVVPAGAVDQETRQGPIAKGFNSAVGFIAPPIVLNLKDLETPSPGDGHGEPLGGIDDQPQR